MEKGAVKRKIVVLGGSAGSLEVILSALPGFVCGTPHSFVVVLHRKADNESLLTGILSRRTKMAVKEVEDKEPLLPNTIYLAPPDYHLLLEDDKNFSLDSSEKIHYCRPSIDVTFESVAAVFGSRALGILLSGANADGVQGLKAIKQSGGTTVVQDPASAEVDFMPRQAINGAVVDKVLGVDEIAPCINAFLAAAFD